jgi:hopanoid biosynthesis associated protein HpnK
MKLAMDVAAPAPFPVPFRRALIVTADDFGMSTEVNEAIEIAHRDGILTAASLMVTGAAVEDAIARARRLPALHVGLHLALVDARPALRAEHVPALIEDTGRFRGNMALAGARMFFDPAARAQLRAEIEAQFAAFAATGLAFDHVNAHKHFHMHPTILRFVLDAGRRAGVTSIRLPFEPGDIIDSIEPGTIGLGHRMFALGARAHRKSIARAGFAAPDRVLGLAWSGNMHERRVAALIDALPAGVTELYTHPATVDSFANSAPGYRYRAELAALIAPGLRESVLQAGIALGGYSDFRGASVSS